MNKCLDCAFYDEDLGCTCPSYEMWYACPYPPDFPDMDFSYPTDFPSIFDDTV